MSRRPRHPRKNHPLRVLCLPSCVSAALLLAGCATGSSGTPGRIAVTTSTRPPTPPTTTGPDVIRVVASTNVYGDIVSTIGGNQVAVTAFISDPSQDPHSFESSAQNKLAVKKAAIIVENGGGYDDFMDRLVSAAGTKAPVLNAVDLSGRKPSAGADLNEHVWYDFAAVRRFAQRVVVELSAADPGSAPLFVTNGRAFLAAVDGLVAREAAAKAAHNGVAVAITEPVPLYLLEAEGLVNKTPAAFSEAVEEGNDVSPTVLRDTLALYTAHQVKALVYNQQTSGPVTQRVEQAARANGIPVIAVTETLPPGQHYLSWMRTNLNALDVALAPS